MCAEWQNTLPPLLVMITTAGGSRSLRGTGANEDAHAVLVMRIGTPTRVPADDTTFLARFLFSLCVLHVGSGNVFDTRGKPSDLPAETIIT